MFLRLRYFKTLSGTTRFDNISQFSNKSIWLSAKKWSIMKILSIYWAIGSLCVPLKLWLEEFEIISTLLFIDLFWPFAKVSVKLHPKHKLYYTPILLTQLIWAAEWTILDATGQIVSDVLLIDTFNNLAIIKFSISNFVYNLSLVSSLLRKNWRIICFN